MAYGRRGRGRYTGRKRRRNKYYRSTGGYSKGISYKNRTVALEIKSMSPAVASYGNIGLISDFASSNHMYQMNKIDPGSAPWQRIGRKVWLLSLSLTFNYFPIAAASANLTQYHWGVIYDRATNGVAPKYSDVFSDFDTIGTQITNAQNGINPNNKERFIVLRSKRGVLPQVTAATLSGQTGFTVDTDKWQENEYINLAGLVSVYDAAAGVTTISSMIKGGLFFFAVADIASAAWNINTTAAFRLRYTEA